MKHGSELESYDWTHGSGTSSNLRGICHLSSKLVSPGSCYSTFCTGPSLYVSTPGVGLISFRVLKPDMSFFRDAGHCGVICFKKSDDCYDVARDRPLGPEAGTATQCGRKGPTTVSRGVVDGPRGCRRGDRKEYETRQSYSGS